MKSELLNTLSNCYCIYEDPDMHSTRFGKITDKMYASQKMDSTFTALGKAVGEDYNVSDRALGT